MSNAFTRHDDADATLTEPPIDLDAAAAHAARPMSIADVLAAARMPEAHAEICLRTDLVAEYDSVLAELRPLLDTEGNVMADEEATVGDQGPAARAQALADRARELAAQMRAETWRPRFRGLSSDALTVFQEQHYPKKQGAPLAEYHNELIAATMVDPSASVDDVVALRKKLPAQEFAKLISTAQTVCTRVVDVPKSLGFSQTLAQP